MPSGRAARSLPASPYSAAASWRRAATASASTHKISDRAYIIEKGRIHFQGTIEELEKNREIQEKYLMI